MGLIILPFISEIGIIVLQYILAALILCYVFFILVYKIIYKRGFIQIVSIIEMVLDMILALILIFNFKLNFIMFNELYYVISLFLIIYSVFSIIRGFYINRTSPKKYPIYLLIIDLVVLIVALLGFNFPILDNNELIIIMSCFCFICSIIALCFGIVVLRKDNKS